MSELNRAAIAEITGTTVQQATTLHGGMIGNVYRVRLSDERDVVAKVAGADGTLDIEGYMLRYLRDKSRLPVPEVLHSAHNLLLMTLVPGSSNLTADVQRHAAELLADLHNVTAPNFGLERATLIGPLHQPNPLSDSWVDFFRSQRLLYMARVCLDAGRIQKPLMQRIERLAAQLDNWLQEPDAPSLIHGDVWTTNVLAQGGRVTGFIDPAIYYGHAEMELAYTALFGTFGDAFFGRYAQLRPLASGFFETRRHIYSLYPLLVHVRLFGGGYATQVESILRRFGN